MTPLSEMTWEYAVPNFPFFFEIMGFVLAPPFTTYT